MNRPPVSHHRSGRKQGTGRLVHERHELVRKARHGASDTNPADVWTPADSTHPAALADVTLHDGSPATEFHDAGGRTILFGELRLLIISAAIASFVYGCAKQPSGTQRIVERNHGSASGGHVQQVQKNFHKIVRLHE